MEPRETEFLCASLITQWLENNGGGVSRIDACDLSLCRYDSNGHMVDRTPVDRSNSPSMLAFLLYNSKGIGIVRIALEDKDGTEFGSITVS